MDVTKTIEAHAQWKTKFRAAISKQETLDVTAIAKDNCCELGQWLHGDGRKRHGTLASFKDCVAKHAAFHTEAGKVARLINAKKMQEAEQQLANGTVFSMASTSVGVALSRLKADAKL